MVTSWPLVTGGIQDQCQCIVMYVYKHLAACHHTFNRFAFFFYIVLSHGVMITAGLTMASPIEHITEQSFMKNITTTIVRRTVTVNCDQIMHVAI